MAVGKLLKHGQTPSEEQEAYITSYTAIPQAKNLQSEKECAHGDTSFPALDSAPVSPLHSTSERTPASAVTGVANLLIQQYLETLYLSGTSLAYFAKGPLSRARTIHLEARNLLSLVEALRSLVITVTLADKRYKYTLPAILKTSEDLQDKDEADPKKKKTESKRRSKVAKRAKDGLLPGEDDVLVEWWAMQHSSVSANADLESRLRARLPKLRFRETLLQLVLILETLSLEEQMADPRLATIDRDNASKGSSCVWTEPRTSTKKPKDLVSLAQSLIDRLMIWQSVEVVSGKSQRMREDASGQDLSQPLLSSENSDKIRDFCTDTMIPL